MISTKNDAIKDTTRPQKNGYVNRKKLWLRMFQHQGVKEGTGSLPHAVLFHSFIWHQHILQRCKKVVIIHTSPCSYWGAPSKFHINPSAYFLSVGGNQST